MTIICFSVAALPQNAAGSTKDDLTNLVRISDLIVVGRLEKSLPDSGARISQDYTVVDADFIWGDPLAYLFPQRRTDDPVLFRAESQVGSDLDSMATLATTMIWFLRRSDDNSSLLLYFGVASPREERRIRNYLADHNVILRHAVGRDTGGGVELILRNAIDGDMHIPEIEVKKHIIWHNPGVSLTYHLLDDEGNAVGSIEPFHERVKLLDVQDWLLLQPGEEQIIRFNIGDYYPQEYDRAYEFGIVIEEIGSSSLVIGQLPQKSHR
ncbi:hypothetical protein ACFL6E_07260 [Candidatus Neomarinimicrobiota bacterium]